MKTQATNVVESSELVEFLRNDPELFAIADAIAATQTAGSLSMPFARRRDGARLYRAVGGVLVAAAAAVAIVLISPWSGPGGGIVQQALAAVGSGPVVHAVLESPDNGGTLIDLSTGAVVRRSLTIDVRFNAETSTQAVDTSLDGRPIERLVQTPAGGWTSSGPVITCSWIAAHPDLAMRANVSCPHGVPVGAQGTPVDPAIVGFVDDYRGALASGTAREAGDGVVDGQAVHWLEFPVSGVSTAARQMSERVAVAADTYKPILLQEPGGAEFTVAQIETEPFDSSDFQRPAQTEHVSGSSVVERASVGIDDARGALGGNSVWLGRDDADLELQGIDAVTLNVGFGPLSDKPSFTAPGLELTYVPRIGASPRRGLQISESATCAPGWGWWCDGRDPDPGFLMLRGPLALVRTGSLYVTLWNWDNWPTSEISQIAQSLTRIAATRSR